MTNCVSVETLTSMGPTHIYEHQSDMQSQQIIKGPSHKHNGGLHIKICNCLYNQYKTRQI